MIPANSKRKLRIGLFSDTYRPSVNGIVYVIDILREQFEADGHEVFIFCPTSRANRDAEVAVDTDHIIRFPSIKGAFFEDYDLSVFFPPRELRRIKEMELDIIMFFTPGQIGLMAVYAAKKLDLPLISQHSTDIYEYVEHYPATLPGIAALSGVLPFTIKMHGKDVISWVKTMRPRRPSEWGRQAIERLLTIVHQKCDAVIVLSKKSYNQLSNWEGGESCRFELIPTGVDALPAATKTQIADFRAQYGIKPQDKVVTYIGRLSAEKNLDILIPVMERLITMDPHMKLLLVGDFEYREVLEKKAEASSAANHIIFTGKFPRESLGCAYGASDIFAFPSVKDTQGLVLHEAAHAGLPIVIVDRYVSEVVLENENGLVADNDPVSIAAVIMDLLSDDELRAKFGRRSKAIARQYTECGQTQKLIEVFYDVIAERELAAAELVQD